MQITKKTPYPQFHRKLYEWYRQNGRHDLPWRHAADPYRVYVSEIMLQQTQVETVRTRYYQPFLKRFPSLTDLASADLSEVLKLWEGLGYYSRARNLHAAAKACNGRLPQTVEQLQALPGIGRNTAHAIAALALQQPVAVMEANVKRVVSRIFSYSHPTPSQLWESAEALLDPHRPFDYNQAMMDIGAIVCTPRKPNCPVCPAAVICKGRASPELFPARKQTKAIPTRRKQILVIQNSTGKIFAFPRSGRFLHGLYQFVELNADEKEVWLNDRSFTLKQTQRIGSISQTYSHFKLEANVYALRYPYRTASAQWHSFPELKQLPFSNAEKKILKLLSSSFDRYFATHCPEGGI